MNDVNNEDRPKDFQEMVNILWADVIDLAINDQGMQLTGNSCNHTWSKYEGLIHSFEYCTLCDERRI